jgi:hypothetical protein
MKRAVILCCLFFFLLDLSCDGCFGVPVYESENAALTGSHSADAGILHFWNNDIHCKKEHLHPPSLPSDSPAVILPSLVQPIPPGFLITPQITDFCQLSRRAGGMPL